MKQERKSMCKNPISKWCALCAIRDIMLYIVALLMFIIGLAGMLAFCYFIRVEDNGIPW